MVQLEPANTTIKAVDLTAGTTATTVTVVVPHHHLQVTTQGELVNRHLPQGQFSTPQQEVIMLAQGRGRS